MNKPVLVAIALGSVMLMSCGMYARERGCDLAAASEYEECRVEARDSKWDQEADRLNRVKNAASPEEKRVAYCDALREPELSQCLAGIRDTEGN